MNDEKNYQYDFKVATATAIIFTQIPSHLSAASQIFKLRQSTGIQRCKCLNPEFILSKDARRARCKLCGTTVSTTQDTVLEATSELVAWLVAIKLMEQGLIVSGNRLARLTGITSSCANLIIKKLQMVVLAEMPENFMLVSAHRFQKIICRRTVNTPARQHAYIEQISIEKEYALKKKSHIKPDISDKQEMILSQMSEGPISLDALYTQISTATAMHIGEFYSNITMLELDGFAEQLRDGKFVKIDDETESGLIEMLHGASEETLQNHIEQIIEFTHFVFQSVSRKYLQLFMAAYWCHTDRKKWCKDALLTACLKHPAISAAKLAAYSSPPLIKIMPFNPDSNPS